MMLARAVILLLFVPLWKSSRGFLMSSIFQTVQAIERQPKVVLMLGVRLYCFALTSPPLMLCVYLQTFEAALYLEEEEE